MKTAAGTPARGKGENDYEKSFHTVKKAGILTAAAVLGTAALAGCGSKADTTESAASSEEATEAVGEAEASDAQLVIAGGDSALD